LPGGKAHFKKKKLSTLHCHRLAFALEVYHAIRFINFTVNPKNKNKKMYKKTYLC